MKIIKALYAIGVVCQEASDLLLCSMAALTSEHDRRWQAWLRVVNGGSLVHCLVCTPECGIRDRPVGASEHFVRIEEPELVAGA